MGNDNRHVLKYHCENVQEFKFSKFRNHSIKLPKWRSGKESTCSAGDSSSSPASGRFPGGGDDNHSSILAWKIPWTEVPDRLQSIALQRAGHD